MAVMRRAELRTDQQPTTVRPLSFVLCPEPQAWVLDIKSLVNRPLPSAQRLGIAASKRGFHFSDDGQRHFFGRVRTEIEPNRGMQAAGGLSLEARVFLRKI